jgi:hypothetical protein
VGALRSQSPTDRDRERLDRLAAHEGGSFRARVLHPIGSAGLLEAARRADRRDKSLQIWSDPDLDQPGPVHHIAGAGREGMGVLSRTTSASVI